MFAHLHTHSEFSLLDGLGRIPDLLQRGKELGMDAMALTDHGSLYGAIDFYRRAKELGIKPIIGVEAYVAPQGRHSRKPGDKQPYHLVLLARNDEGYHNLIQLVSRAHLEGFYYRPRMDRELLEQYRKGIIALSGCLAAEVPRLLLDGRWDDAREAAIWHRETFDGYFFELQRHPNVPDLARLNQALIALSRETEIPLVATNDLHYVRQKDAPAQDILLCIQTNATVHEQNRMKMDDDSFYLKSEEEMRELFSDVPEAVDNTWRIAEMCDLKLEFNRLHLPQIEIPTGMSSFEYLSKLCWEGLERRYGPGRQDARERLAYELDVIQQMQFPDYFLVVWDIVSFTRGRGILVGVRGSAAASIVLYCLNITDIDPLQYTLVFERFLNLERKELPDIDLDFQDDRRGEVIEYVTRRFGQDHVAQIITFGTLGAKAALRDVGRALAMSYADVDRVARLVPFSAHPVPLDQALEQVQALRDAYQQDQQVRKLVDAAKQLEGVARHASTHAAGVVISREPLVSVVPLQRATRGGSDEATPMTQWDMDTVAKVGLLKMDFLGLINLTTLSRTRDLIAKTRDETIDLQRIPLDDAKTFDLLAQGETTGLFQLEGVGMRRYIKQLKPRNLGEVSAMIALYRPGPMEHIPRFIDAKYGRVPVTYPHPDLAQILSETYGVIVYQDQVLQIARKFAGYSLGEADVVRKAMGKKIAAIMAQERDKFIKGAIKQSYTEADAQAVFDLIEPFAGYAFNKAHSVSYAFIAYQTAYFKANYAVEYMTSLFNCHLGAQEKAGTFADECQVLNISVLPPDINASEEEFSVEGDPRQGHAAIRTGLAAVKNVGRGAVEALVAERRARGPFASIDDFIRRADLHSLNRRGLESLIKAGALDSLGRRGALLESAERILSLAQKEQRVRESRQGTMFDQMGGSGASSLPVLDLAPGDVLSAEKGAWEKELTGIYFTEDPFRALRQAAGQDVVSCADVSIEMADQRVAIAGRVSSIRTLTTKRGEPFASVVLQDLSGTLEVTVWPNTYRTTQALWTQGAPLRVDGPVRVRDDRISIACDQVRVLELSAAPSPDPDGDSPAPFDLDPGDDETYGPPPAGSSLSQEVSLSAGALPVPPPTPPPAGAQDAAPQAAAAPQKVAQAPVAVPGPSGNGGETKNGAPGADGHKTTTNGDKGRRTKTVANGGKRYQLILHLKETSDEAKDLERFQEVYAALEAFPGRDEVRLIVQQESGKNVPLALPLQAAYGPELASRIAGLLGEGALGVQEFLGA